MGAIPKASPIGLLPLDSALGVELDHPCVITSGSEGCRSAGDDTSSVLCGFDGAGIIILQSPIGLLPLRPTGGIELQDPEISFPRSKGGRVSGGKEASALGRPDTIDDVYSVSAQVAFPKTFSVRGDVEKARIRSVIRLIRGREYVLSSGRNKTASRAGADGEELL